LLMLSWRSYLGVATSSVIILSINAANASIMGISRKTALGLFPILYPMLLILCWHSVDTHF
jgi:ACR3 family arsenite efflux pump ArsB